MPAARRDPLDTADPRMVEIIARHAARMWADPCMYTLDQVQAAARRDWPNVPAGITDALTEDGWKRMNTRDQHFAPTHERLTLIARGAAR